MRRSPAESLGETETDTLASTRSTLTSAVSRGRQSPSRNYVAQFVQHDVINGITVYTIKISNHDGHEWYLTKRYSEFREMHTCLKRPFWSVVPRIPGRRLLHSRCNQTPQFIAERRLALEQYLNAVLCLDPLLETVRLKQFIRRDAEVEALIAVMLAVGKPRRDLTEVPHGWKALKLHRTARLCEGIRVNSDGYVEEILLPFSNLQGVLPAVFHAFKRVRKIDFHDNPRLTGPLPDLRDCEKLKEANFRGCSFTGRLSSKWPTTLGTLDISGNRELHGNVSLGLVLQCLSIKFDDCKRRDRTAEKKKDTWMCGPFISGVSMASEDLKYLLFSRNAFDINEAMLNEAPAKGDESMEMYALHGSKWVAWQEVWLNGLRSLRDRDVFVVAGPPVKSADNFFEKKFLTSTGDDDNTRCSFDPSYALPAGQRARCILDWERLQMQRVAKENNLRVVFVRPMQWRNQVDKPDWYL